MPIVEMWKHDVTDAMKDELDWEHKYDRDIIVVEIVWLGINVTLPNGAHIGRGFIVGAGCVVSGEWSLYNVIVGNPATLKRPLLSIDEIHCHEEKLYPLGRYGDPNDIAWAIIYLLSDASSWMTGTNMIIDGGLSIK